MIVLLNLNNTCFSKVQEAFKKKYTISVGDYTEETLMKKINQLKRTSTNQLLLRNLKKCNNHKTLIELLQEENYGDIRKQIEDKEVVSFYSLKNDTDDIVFVFLDKEFFHHGIFLNKSVEEYHSRLKKIIVGGSKDSPKPEIMMSFPRKDWGLGSYEDRLGSERVKTFSDSFTIGYVAAHSHVADNLVFKAIQPLFAQEAKLKEAEIVAQVVKNFRNLKANIDFGQDKKAIFMKKGLSESTIRTFLEGEKNNCKAE